MRRAPSTSVSNHSLDACGDSKTFASSTSNPFVSSRLWYLSSLSSRVACRLQLIRVKLRLMATRSEPPEFTAARQAVRSI